MPNETPSSAFPATSQTLSEIKDTTADAARDLVSSASVHAAKAQGQLKALAGHFQEEGEGKINEVRAQLDDVVRSFRDYASERPLVCIGVALTVGFLFGITRRSVSDR